LDDLPVLFIKEKGQTVAILDFATKQRLTIVNLKGNLSETKISDVRSVLDITLQTSAYQIIFGTSPLDKQSENLYTIDKCFMAAGNDELPILPIVKSQSLSSIHQSPLLLSPSPSPSASLLGQISTFPTQGVIGRATIWNFSLGASSGFLTANDDMLYSSPLSTIRQEIINEEIDISSRQWVFLRPDGNMVIPPDEDKLKAHEVLRSIDLKGKWTHAFFVQDYVLSRVSFINDATNKSLGFLENVSPTTPLAELQPKMVCEELIESGQTVTFYNEGDMISRAQAKRITLQQIFTKEDDKFIVRITVT